MAEPIPEGMGRCEVTGSIVPEDELVVIRGKRVSAEGKAILLDSLNAGESAPGDLETAGMWGRFGAYFLDGLLLTIPYLVIIFAFFGLTMITTPGPGGLAANLGFKVLALVLSVISILYYGFMHGYKGQTLGKMAAKMRVVRLDGQPMDMKTGMIRSLGLNGLGLVNGVVSFTDVNFLVTLFGGIAMVYFVADVVVTIIDSAEHKSIHDLIAGTRVIKIET